MAQSRSPRRLLKDALAALDRLAEVLDQHRDAREQLAGALSAEHLARILDTRRLMAEAVRRLGEPSGADRSDS